MCRAGRRTPSPSGGRGFLFFRFLLALDEAALHQLLVLFFLSRLALEEAALDLFFLLGPLDRGGVLFLTLHARGALGGGLGLRWRGLGHDRSGVAFRLLLEAVRGVADLDAPRRGRSV